MAIQVAGAHKGDNRHNARHGLGRFRKVTLKPTLDHADLGTHDIGDVVVKEGAQRQAQNARLCARHHGLACGIDDLFNKGGVAARTQQRSDQIAVGRKVAQQLNRTGRRLELIDVVIEIGQLSCGDELNALTNLGQQAVLDLIDKVGNIAVVRIERAARKASALGERRDINARKVAAFGKFAGKCLAKGTL